MTLRLGFWSIFHYRKTRSPFHFHVTTQANELNNVINIRGCNTITECQELWNHAGTLALVPPLMIKVSAPSSTSRAFSLSVPHHRGQSFIASVLGAGNIHWRSYTKVCSGAAHYYYMQEKGFYTRRARERERARWKVMAPTECCTLLDKVCLFERERAPPPLSHAPTHPTTLWYIRNAPSPAHRRVRACMYYQVSIKSLRKRRGEALILPDDSFFISLAPSLLLSASAAFNFKVAQHSGISNQPPPPTFFIQSLPHHRRETRC